MVYRDLLLLTFLGLAKSLKPLTSLHFVDILEVQNTNKFNKIITINRTKIREIFDIAGNKYRVICKYSIDSTSIRLYYAA